MERHRIQQQRSVSEKFWWNIIFVKNSFETNALNALF